ncbi:uncharacterized protein VICG_01962 [Vittaforma corneae ATCC 50505]|uniref:Pre-mRNA polyadenylation factor Fip1 domain-containing protein n=1 Tax=Vittaforma corneae (strain ATCC 50505) TaxID=993615 RepID=L2GJE8_VITCO|nr:uncharacterized protein VICG_01962 [Vittaforma corneae ATCC 50505]ELA41003.1 hypothetical protein VICG_01962 [Vittaforma corneae ATCC 50505]
MDEDEKSGSVSTEESSSEVSLELVVDKSKTMKIQAESGVDMNLYDFDLDTIKDKPWLKPGADITDYFNYGFTEKTWKKYCDMQREIRGFVEREESNMSRNERDHRYDQRPDDRYGKRRRIEGDRYARGYGRRYY